MATQPPAIPPNPPPSQNIQKSPDAISFQTQNVPPSQYIYLQRGDVLLFRFLTNNNGIQPAVTYRYLTPQGEVKEGTQVFNAITGQGFQALFLNECWLLSFGLTTGFTQPSGSWTFAQVYIDRGFQVGAPQTAYGMVWEGYIGGTTFTGWPGSPAKAATDGAGMLRSIVGTTPGAGIDISETVPANRRWSLLAFTASLTSSAAAANRNVTALYDDGANAFFLGGTFDSQAASLVFTYSFYPGFRALASLGGGVPLQAMIPIQLKTNFRIRTQTNNLQAGDQWTAPKYLVIEWGAYDI